jgi:hypothetical protein
MWRVCGALRALQPSHRCVCVCVRPPPLRPQHACKPHHQTHVPPPPLHPQLNPSNPANSLTLTHMPAGAVSRCSINACLPTVGSLDGCSITTAEGLGNSKTGYHPIQGLCAVCAVRSSYLQPVHGSDLAVCVSNRTKQT